MGAKSVKASIFHCASSERWIAVYVTISNRIKH